MPRNLKEQYQKKYGIKTSLRGYQLKATKVGVENDCYALLMAPRLGKTRVDIAVTGYRRRVNKIQRWVIIGPSISKGVWKREIRNTLRIPHRVEIVEGKAAERQLLLKGWKDDPSKLSIIVMNFEATWRLKKFLYKWNPDKITVDESHRIKNHAAKQSRTIQILGRRARYRSILTGTFLSTPMDVFSQFKFLDPTVYGERIADFRERYVRTYGYGGHKPKTFQNLDELESKFKAISFILSRKDAGGFPEEHEEIITFPLTNPALKHYLEMEDELKTMVNGIEVRAPIVLTQVLRMAQITGGFLPVKDPDDYMLAVNTPLGNDRIRALTGVLDEYPPEEPLVIFAKFRYEVTEILGLLKRRQRTANFIVGGMKDREKAIVDFQSGKVNTCVAQIRAAGISVELSRSRDAIFYSNTGSFIDYEQAKARVIARNGGKVSFIHLAAEDTLDEGVIESIRTNQSLTESIMKRLS